jgi:hypothetical protein
MLYKYIYRRVFWHYICTFILPNLSRIGPGAILEAAFFRRLVVITEERVQQQFPRIPTNTL